MLLSVLIPVYNERDTIGRVIAAVSTVLPTVDKEIVLVDDASIDGTTVFLRETLGSATGPYRSVRFREDSLFLEPAGETDPGTVRFHVGFHESNRGKGAAVRTAMQAATGDVLVIQDADLEYDPKDWAQMYALIAEKKVADVVYGSRFYGRPHRSLFFHHFLANKLISFLFNLLYNQTLTDIEVCYKMFTREVKESLALTADDFGIEIELSGQIALNRKLRIYEVGISYYGRTYQEGKKINWKDGVKALWYLVKYRF